MASTDSVETLLSELDALLGEATLKALRAAKDENAAAEAKKTSYILVAPREVTKWILKHSTHDLRSFERTFPPIDPDQAVPEADRQKPPTPIETDQQKPPTPIEEAATYLQKIDEHKRQGSVHLFVVFHPGRDRIVPAPGNRGPFHLSSALEREDQVWLIRPQSFFLQLLEDEYLIFPNDEEEEFWRGPAEFWWKIRAAYCKCNKPFRRGSTSSGWVELASRLVQTLFEPQPRGSVSRRSQSDSELKCTFAQLMHSGQFFVLSDALNGLECGSDHDATQDLASARARKDLSLAYSFQELKASITRFHIAPQSLLLANLVEDFSESPRSGSKYSGNKPEAKESSDDGTGRKVEERLALLRVRSPDDCTFACSGSNWLSRRHAAWLRDHLPSFVFVRWDPIGQLRPRSYSFFAYEPFARYSPSLQENRMKWYKNDQEKRRANLSRLGFAGEYQAGDSNFLNVGINHGPFADGGEEKRLTRPWILTTDFEPFQEALAITRDFLSNTKDGQDPSFQQSLNQIVSAVCEKCSEDSFYQHYLLWYYEYFLGAEFPGKNRKDLHQALADAQDSLIPTLVFCERHFHAFKAPVDEDNYEAKGRRKMITLSLGLDGDSELSSGDIWMVHRIIDQLAKLRAYRKLTEEAEQLRSGLAIGLYHQLGQVLEVLKLVTKHPFTDRALAFRNLAYGALTKSETDDGDTGGKALDRLVADELVFAVHYVLRSEIEFQARNYEQLRNELQSKVSTITFEIDFDDLYSHADDTTRSDARLYGFVLQEVFVNALRGVKQVPNGKLKVSRRTDPGCTFPLLAVCNNVTEAEFDKPHRAPSQRPSVGESTGWGRYGIWAYFKQVYDEDITKYLGPVKERDECSYLFVTSVPLIPRRSHPITS